MATAPGRYRYLPARISLHISQFEYVAHFYGGLQLAQLSWARTQGRSPTPGTSPSKSSRFQHLQWRPLRHLIPLSGRTISAILHFPFTSRRGGSGHKTWNALLQLQQQLQPQHAATPTATQRNEFKFMAQGSPLVRGAT